MLAVFHFSLMTYENSNKTSTLINMKNTADVISR